MNRVIDYVNNVGCDDDDNSGGDGGNTDNDDNDDDHFRGESLIVVN
jgi:hypothetical protein